MTPDHHARGGAAVAVLSRMDAWEANLVLNLRLWCLGPSGQNEVWKELQTALPTRDARNACRAFDVLLNTLIANSHRPLVRHDVGCSCVGADENIVVNLVRTAAEGHLNDAALIATLIVGPSQAEHIAMLAGEVGTCMQRIHHTTERSLNQAGSNVVRLH
ncbi:MAG: hypothetical protein ABJQ70_00830 [Roseobacter sp.]